MAERLESNRMLRLNDVVRQLVEVPVARSLFGDWKVEERHAAVALLERALIDPEGLLARHGAPPTFRSLRHSGEVDFIERIARHLEGDSDADSRTRLESACAEAIGKLSSFESLLDVDWLIDTQALRQGDVPGALAKFHPGPSLGYAPGSAFEMPDFQVKPTDPTLVAYRDYLRTILCGAPSSGAYSSLHQRLSNRLHQDFSITDTTSRPANEILVALLKVILQAPKQEGYGFGVQASAIEPQEDRTAREYVEYLISLAGTSAAELGVRYRIDFTRPDGAVSSRVQENISTLQRFMTDSYQQEAPDPYDPFIQESGLGWAPFFLHYEEWQSMRARFFPENHYPLKQLFSTGVRPANREYAEARASTGNEWFITMLQAGDALAAGSEARDKGQFTKAAEHFSNARALAFRALGEGRTSKAARAVSGESSPPLATLVQPAIDGLQAIQVSDKDGLEDLIEYLRPFRMPSPDPINPYDEFNPWLEASLAKHLMTLLRLGLIIAPSCLAEVALELGDYESAVTYFGWTTRFLVLRANIEDSPGWYDIPDPGPYPYWKGNLPYSCNPALVDTGQVHDPSPLGVVTWETFMRLYLEGISHPIEQKHLRLLYAETILEWADALYRTDDGPSIQRARELYKAVLFIHGLRPDIVDPNWPKGSLGRFTRGLLEYLQTSAISEDASDGFGSATVQVSRRPGVISGRGLKPVLTTRRSSRSAGPAASIARSGDSIPMEVGSVASEAVLSAAQILKVPGALGFLPLVRNPWMSTQINRARLGLYQIEAGLNFYGLTDDLVPTLRYRPLKDAADRFAGASKSAQDDLLLYLGKVEESLKEQLFTAQLLKKAQYQAEIATEQVGLALHNESLAQQQVRAIEQEIEDKRSELREEQSFWNQAFDFFGGMIGSITSLPDDLLGSAGSGTKAALGYGAYEGSGAFAGLGAGGGVMAGYGVLVYGGVTSMSNLADRYESMADQIHHLEDSVLPMARANLAARERETRIARLQQSIAESDVEFASNLIDFEEKRFLNIDFWNRLAGLMKRVLRRYLALGTRYGWMAERALAYEQDRSLDIIRLDYVPRALQGITGADLLQRDLAELEASRLNGIRSAVPITHTFSLAFEFPLEFGQLLKTGRCTFRTRDLPFRLAYPGTHGHRIRAVTAAVRSTTASAPFRGLLGNSGVSLVRGKTGERHVSIRPMERFPLSEFRLRRDMDVFSLPDETLLTFEGSGVDSTWTLEFPHAANPYGLGNLLDVELTFDLRAHHSPGLYESDLASPPTGVGRSVLVSAAHFAPAELESLQGGAQHVSVSFDMNAIGLPAAESDRTISNIVIIIAGSSRPSGQAEVEGSVSVPAITVQFEDGIAASNAAPLVQEGSPIPPMPLNAFVGASVDQVFTVNIDKAHFPGVEFDEVRDLILGVEYRAQI
jgi:hypothetical protein